MLKSNFGNAEEKLDLLLLDVSGYGHMPPLGLMYIASYINARGINAKVHILQGEYSGYSKKYLTDIVDKFRPTAIGLPVTAESVESVRRYCLWLREISNAKIIIGGPEATANPDKIYEYTGADALVIGDGEVKVLNLLRAWKKGGIPEDKRGLFIKVNDILIKNYDRSLLVDIDSLPFPQEECLISKKYSTYSLLTGRGCPFECTFCYEGNSRTFHLRNTESVIDELNQILEKKPKILAFIDDTFTLDKNKVSIVCDVIKKKYRGPWFCEGRVGVLYHKPEIIDILADAGLTRIQLGLESGSEKVLKAYKKDTTPEQISSVFSHCHNAGITSVIGNFIVGGAYESNETFNDTIEIAKKLISNNPGSAELLTCYLYPYKGTEVERYPEKYGLHYIENLERYNAASRIACINTTDELSRGEISQFRETLKGVIHHEMQKVIDELPANTILRHMVNARDFNILSEWYNAFLYSKPLALYARLQSQYNALSWLEIKYLDNWADYCPVRVGYNIISVNDDNITILTRKNRYTVLSGMVLKIFELSSGKISIKEMIPYLRVDNKKEMLEERELLHDIRVANDIIADNFLCVFREI